MNTPINEAVELLPCPFCGAVPDAENDATFQLTDGVKYGAVNCCGTGPEVRTDYKDVSHWKHAAIEAWNSRAALPPPIVEPGNCHCEACEPHTVFSSRMILCATCGNKRCPHATDHRNACTNSNEPGQAGSSYANCTLASTLGQQVARAQAEVATWSPEKRASVRLEGSGQYTPASEPSDGAADAVDYKLLLAKYIEHVGAEEGSTTIDELHRSSNGKWRGMSDRVEFDQLEKEALEEAEKFYLHASTHTTTGGEKP